MSFIRCQHIYVARSGLAEDDIVNTFHFLGPPPTTVNLTALAQNVIAFYDTAAAPQAALRTYVAEIQFATIRHRLKFYDMNAEPPRAPLLDYTPATVTPANNTGTNLPAEVALCLSYRSTPASGVVAARRRGRIYIGPLQQSAAVSSGGGAQARPDLALRNALPASAVKLKADAQINGWSWVGYSPTSAAAGEGAPGELGVFPIQEFLVDDAFDTQRRRGPARSLRTVTPAN